MRNTSICLRCDNFRQHYDSIWCSSDSFNLQKKCSEDLGMMEEVFLSQTPPGKCPYQLEHLVMADDNEMVEIK